MKLNILKGSTDVTVYVFVQDSSSTTGAGLTGLLFNTASLAATFARPLTAAASLTLVTQTVTGAHTDGGFVEVSSSLLPGVYRLDLSDTIIASGVDSVVAMLKGAANMAPLPLEIQLVSYDPNDAADLGLSNLNATVSSRMAEASIDTTGGKVDGVIANDDMRGTDSAALASVCTESRLAELDAANLPTDVAAIDTATMRGTDGVDTATMRGTDGVDTATMRGTDSANTTAPDNTGIAAIQAVTDVIPDSGAMTSIAQEVTLGTPIDTDISTDIANVPNLTRAGGDIDGFSFEDSQKIILAAAGGKLSGAATPTNILRAADDSKARITATVDADGNRSAVTLDGTG